MINTICRWMFRKLKTRVLLIKGDGFAEVNYAEKLGQGRYVVVKHCNYDTGQTGAIILNADGTVGIAEVVKDVYPSKFAKWEILK